MIWKIEDVERPIENCVEQQEKGSFLRAFSINSCSRVSVVGAGGKTTLVKRLAEECAGAGWYPIVMTTTHMWQEDRPECYVGESLEELLKVREKHGSVLAGADAGKGKIGALPEKVQKELFQLPSPILIEADGAKGLPVKFPADHEPVILPQTDVVISVYGLSALGKPLKDVCFRWEEAAGFLGKRPEEKLTTEDMAKMACSPCGGGKGVLPGMRHFFLFNQADTEEDRRAVYQIWRQMDPEVRRKGSVFVSYFTNH